MQRDGGSGDLQNRRWKENPEGSAAVTAKAVEGWGMGHAKIPELVKCNGSLKA